MCSAALALHWHCKVPRSPRSVFNKLIVICRQAGLTPTTNNVELLPVVTILQILKNRNNFIISTTTVFMIQFFTSRPQVYYIHYTVHQNNLEKYKAQCHDSIINFNRLNYKIDIRHSEIKINTILSISSICSWWRRRGGWPADPLYPLSRLLISSNSPDCQPRPGQGRTHRQRPADRSASLTSRGEDIARDGSV